MPKKVFKKRTYRKKPASAVTKRQAKSIVRKAETGSSFNKMAELCTKADRMGKFFLCKNEAIYLSMNQGGVSVVNSAGENMLASGGWVCPVVAPLTGTLGVPGVDSSWVNLTFIHRFIDLSNYTDLAGSYDGYKYVKSQCKIDLLTDYNPSSSSTQRALIPEVYIYNDYDDANGNTFEETEQRITRLKRLTTQYPSITTTFTPNSSVNVYKSTGTTIAYAAQKDKQWIDVSYGDVEHYGIKMTFNNLLSNEESAGCPIIRLQFSHIINVRTQR